MSVSKSFKVYGAEGHRQKMSFDRSVRWDWSNEQDGVRIFEAINSDITGTNEYSIIRITRNTEEECYDELEGQISDGYFENCNVGRDEEIDDTSVVEMKEKRMLELWDELGDIAVEPIKDTIEDPFKTFEAGTFREDIWKWFEETFNVSVHDDLMFREHEDKDL